MKLVKMILPRSSIDSVSIKGSVSISLEAFESRGGEAQSSSSSGQSLLNPFKVKQMTISSHVGQVRESWLD